MEQGFTLIELLVVISIIGLLSSIVLTSLNSARIKARDTQRKSDLHQIGLAMELYYDSNQTYIIPTTGSNGCSCGWFNYENGSSYAISIAHGLANAGLLSISIQDPLIKSTNQTPQYMKYQCGFGYYVYAKLENPSPEDIATYDNSVSQGCSSSPGTNYGMNYAVGHK